MLDYLHGLVLGYSFSLIIGIIIALYDRKQSKKTEQIKCNCCREIIFKKDLEIHLKNNHGDFS